MSESPPVYALLHVAAGPRLGYGHLRRAIVLAQALGRPVALHLRGAAEPPAGWLTTAGGPARSLAALQPRVLVVDDPHAGYACRWVEAARRLGVPSVSLHDVGLAAVPSDLAIDGSLATRRWWPARRVLTGARYAVIAAGPDGGRRAARSRAVTVAISLGGGQHAASIGLIVHAIRRAVPDARLLVAAGLHGRVVQDLPAGVHAMTLAHGLGPLLRQADIAVLGGGVSLYEAAAAGVPAVAAPVVSAQDVTVRAFARAGLAASAGPFTPDLQERARRVAYRVRELANNPLARGAMRRRGPGVVDGRGARRVARAIVSLVEARDA
jgi:spore coat polysaccharide biosynthesis predicted glycosyltransferase SpsG